MALAWTFRPYSFRAVLEPSARRRLDAVPAGPASSRQARAVGAGSHGDSGERAHLPARTSRRGSHPRRGARGKRCAVGDGGRGKMFLPLGRDRRTVGRSTRARLHCNQAACGRVGTQRYSLLACPAWRQCEPQRRKDALADRERAVFGQRVRSARGRNAGLEGRIVPGTGHAARPLEHRA